MYYEKDIELKIKAEPLLLKFIQYVINFILQRFSKVLFFPELLRSQDYFIQYLCDSDIDSSNWGNGYYFRVGDDEIVSFQLASVSCWWDI